MKSALLVILIVGACSSWKRDRTEPWNYNNISYTDDCFNESGKLIIEGLYQNRNLYCMNPELYCTDSTKRFATIDITINDTVHIPTDSLATSAYEIPLNLYNFKAGDSVNIVIRHYAGATPKLLNPEVR